MSKIIYLYKSKRWTNHFDYREKIFDKKKKKKELDKQLTILKEKEEELQVDAKKLQNPDYVARYAREKYSYSKDGEYILQIPDK